LGVVSRSTNTPTGLTKILLRFIWVSTHELTMRPNVRDILHPLYYEILNALAEEDRPLTRSEINHRVSYAGEMTIYRRLKKLVEWSLVSEKWSTETEKPYKVYILTEKGRRVWEAFESLRRVFERDS